MMPCPIRRAALAAAGAAAVAAIALAAGCASTPANDPTALAERYRAAIASPVRTDADRRMDASRQPALFLPFTRAAPGMQVLDVAAGGGYTSQLLALVVAPGGRLYAQREQPSPALTKRLADAPQERFVVVYRPYEDPVPPEAPPLDLVTLVLNYHDISYLPVDRAKMNARIFAALKSGGYYVVVDHAALPGTGISAGRTLHRIEEAVVVDEIRRAGFALEAQGAFLRNPADPRDTTSNNPPVPTDRFALRFVKP
jgi:predicted methyltransferase